MVILEEIFSPVAVSANNLLSAMLVYADNGYDCYGLMLAGLMT